MGQLAAARAQLAQATAEQEQSRVKFRMSEQELKTLETRWKGMERDAGDGQRKIQVLKAAVESCRVRVAKCGWNDDLERSGESKLRETKAKVRDLTQASFASMTRFFPSSFSI